MSHAGSTIPIPVEITATHDDLECALGAVTKVVLTGCNEDAAAGQLHFVSLKVILTLSKEDGGFE